MQDTDSRQVYDGVITGSIFRYRIATAIASMHNVNHDQSTELSNLHSTPLR